MGAEAQEMTGAPMVRAEEGEVNERFERTVAASAWYPRTRVCLLFQISPWHEYFTVQTDGRGHFEVRGQEPGRYIVGEGVIANTVAEWRLRVYYPGVSTREQAIPIDLGDGESRSGIDFKLLPSAK